MHSVVIGGTRGLGREVVRLFVADGNTVSVIGRRAPDPADAAQSGCRFWAADVADENALGQVLAEIVAANGPVDHVVLLQRFKGTDDPWTGEWVTSLGASKRVIETLTPHFSPNGGAVVLVGSVISQFVADGQPVGYHTAKAAMAHMARYYAVNLGPRGIRVNSVSPCTVVKAENRAFYAGDSALTDLFARTIPLGRMGTAAESASVIHFLCSAGASFVTGQEILVDGGVSLVSQEALARKLAGL